MSTLSFDQMRNSLKQEYERRNRFIMGVSHNLKTPLTLIQGYTEALQDVFAGNEEKRKKYLSIIYEKGRILQHRIAELIDFVKLETGEWKKNFQEIALDEFLNTFYRSVRHDAHLYDREIVGDITLPKKTIISCDTRLVYRAFENLFANALQYATGPGPLQLKAYTKKNKIYIENPFQQAATKDITIFFKPYYRESQRRNDYGSGLGLNTVRSIIQSYGWNIEAKPIDQNHIRFTLSIPLNSP